MPVSKTAERELRLARRRTERNKTTFTLTKSTVKKTEKAIFSGDIDTAKEAAAKATSTLDKAANKKVIHANKAARSKSRLMKKLNKAVEISSAKPAAEE